MISDYMEKANFEDTGFAYTLSLISGKHKMVILYCLMKFGVVRFNELKRYLKTVADKTLSANLKELERDQLILRKEYPYAFVGMEPVTGQVLKVTREELCGVKGTKTRTAYHPRKSAC